MAEQPLVAVVTGGAMGIGAAIARELGRAGMHVVVVDPGRTLDGSGAAADSGTSTVDQILEAGGSAQSSNVSVSDADAIQSLFHDLRTEFGAIEAVVTVAGILRPTGFGRGAEEDWRAVLKVHLDGYLNVLRAALPSMVSAGRGQVVGVTSGSGWRQADNGAYGCAKRAVAAITWELGRLLPPGVAVNALSPIAATRMVTGALARPGGEERAAGRDASTGAVALGNARPPEDLAAVGALLASRGFGLVCTGEVISSNGEEISRIVRPALVEVVRRDRPDIHRRSVDDVASNILAAAERAQMSSGGGTPRLAPRGGGPSESLAPDATRHVLMVSDGDALSTAIQAELTRRGATCTAVTPAASFAHSCELLAGAERASGVVDAVIVLPTRPAAAAATAAGMPGWQRFLDEHLGLSHGVLSDAMWTHAVAESSARSGREISLVVIVDATTCGGQSRGQAAAQLSRGSRIASSGRINAFAISLESGSDRAIGHAAELAGHLVTGASAPELSGAELVVAADWLGLRAHPHPAATVVLDGPDLPDWLTDAVRDLLQASAPAAR